MDVREAAAGAETPAGSVPALVRGPPRGAETTAEMSAHGAHEQRERVHELADAIMYRTYQTHAAEPGSILKAFTRVLHRGKDDELMHEVPTMRFDPNQEKCDRWCDYPVADRSLAVAQWSRTTDATGARTS